MRYILFTSVVHFLVYQNALKVNRELRNGELVQILHLIKTIIIP